MFSVFLFIKYNYKINDFSFKWNAIIMNTYDASVVGYMNYLCLGYWRHKKMIHVASQTYEKSSNTYTHVIYVT